MTTNFFSPFSFVAVFGSGNRDPGSGMGKNQDPGSGINIPDPQHCHKENLNTRCLLAIDGSVDTPTHQPQFPAESCSNIKDDVSIYILLGNFHQGEQTIKDQTVLTISVKQP
jgi:hypothetical protein